MNIFPEAYEGLNRLFEYAKSSGLVETGSSSISPSFAESCQEVNTLLRSSCLIQQNGESLNSVWAALGDPSGILYFGGREIAGCRVTAAEHLEYLASVFDRLSPKAAHDVNIIAQSFIDMIHAIPTGPVISFSKNGNFIIPPEAYKPNMTEAEKEPFRVSDDDPRLKDW